MTRDATIELHHRLEGPEDAPVLVMANSLGTTLAMWEPQAPALRERFRLLRYDHRGHGGSPVPEGPYSVEDLGRDALAMLDRLEIERFSFCGLSIGGSVGMWLASEAPDRLERLVLCCTSARFEPPDAYATRARAVRSDGMEPIADAVLQRWFTPAFFETHEGEVERARRMLVSTPPEGYAGCCEAIRDADLRGRLGAIRASTLAIAGSEDPAISPAQAEFIRDSVHDARLVAVEQAAHLANVEQPAALTREILAHVGAKG